MNHRLLPKEINDAITNIDIEIDAVLERIKLSSEIIDTLLDINTKMERTLRELAKLLEGAKK